MAHNFPMVRPITDRDRSAVLRLAHALHKESPRYRDIAFSEGKAIAVIVQMIHHGGGFVAEQQGEIVGMIGGMLTEYYFSMERFAADFALYITPEHRKSFLASRLVRAFERWAFSLGAREVTLGISTEIHPERTVRVYERLGYKLSGYNARKSRV